MIYYLYHLGNQIILTKNINYKLCSITTFKLANLSWTNFFYFHLQVPGCSSFESNQFEISDKCKEPEVLDMMSDENEDKSCPMEEESAAVEILP